MQNKIKVTSMADKDKRPGPSKWQKAGLKHGEYFISRESFLCYCCRRSSNIWRIVGYPGGHPELQCPGKQSKKLVKMAEDVLFRKNANILRELKNYELQSFGGA